MKNGNLHIYTAGGACVTSLGMNLEENITNIKAGKSGIHKHEDKNLSAEAFYGAIINKEKLEKVFNLTAYKGTFTTLEKMFLIVLKDVLNDYQAYVNEDCGIIFSMTKGNIDDLSSDSPNYLHDLAQKVSRTIGMKNEAIVLSNACVSGIMAVSVAKRLIHTGLYKHCLVVGGDIFSRFVFSGFQSFQAVSNEPCKPYDKDRDGITLGEAAAAIFVSKDKSVFGTKTIYEIVGEGSINDANHISGPSRTGEGLFQSVKSAIDEAGIEAKEIDCISSHGTATMYNDEMEAQAFNRIDLQDIPVFSLKACYGHTLGAAGLLEAVVSLRFADENLIPPSFNYKEHGLTLPLNINTEVQKKDINYVLKTASGFGGSNTAVIFKKV
ncbi:MAG TPA: beta-ketoacyl synthase N-terminal-like domain-containing protein [Brumimicrobium sp.]|nr:beta-ketoacyl synthase N-terminal-like domain-containing protein [Brumimicrobium sp.]